VLWHGHRSCFGRTGELPRFSYPGS